MPGCAANRDNQVLRLRIKYMLEVPCRQEIHAVHRSDRDMRGISRFRSGYGLALHKHSSQRLGLIGCREQRNSLENRESFSSGNWIATVTLVNNQAGDK